MLIREREREESIRSSFPDSTNQLIDISFSSTASPQRERERDMEESKALLKALHPPSLAWRCVPCLSLRPEKIVVVVVVAVTN